MEPLILASSVLGAGAAPKILPAQQLAVQGDSVGVNHPPRKDAELLQGMRNPGM